MSRSCKKCGGTVKAEDQFCMHCGMPLEKEEAEHVYREEEKDTKAEVLSFGQCLLLLFLLSIPVVNIILAIIWSISSAANPNKRNFARAWLVLAAIGIVISGILAAAATFFIISVPAPLPYEHHVEYHIEHPLTQMEGILLEDV